MEWGEAALSGGVWTGHGRLAATAVPVAQETLFCVGGVYGVGRMCGGDSSGQPRSVAQIIAAHNQFARPGITGPRPSLYRLGQKLGIIGDFVPDK